MPIRIVDREINRILTLPGGSIDETGVYVSALQSPSGGLVVAANTANQVLSTTATGKFGYLTDVYVFCTATSAVAATLAIQDAVSGAVLWGIAFPVTGPTLGIAIPIRFTNPPRTAAAGGAFIMSTTGAGVTWMATCNGYFSSSIGQ